MRLTHKSKMNKCIEICNGSPGITASRLNAIMREMRDKWGKEPKEATRGIVDNVSSGKTQSVDWHIGQAVIKMMP